jgi:hypothetical protein
MLDQYLQLGCGGSPASLTRCNPAAWTPARLPQQHGPETDGDSEHLGVLYFATTLDGCFGETLARFRPNPMLAALVRDDWAGAHHMPPGHLPKDWRDRRAAVHVNIEQDWKFLDVETVKTRAFLEQELTLGLAALGVESLDVPEIRGKDRRVTQLISEWAYNFTLEVDDDDDDDDEAPFAGIFYSSRISSGTAGPSSRTFPSRMPVRSRSRSTCPS